MYGVRSAGKADQGGAVRGGAKDASSRTGTGTSKQLISSSARSDSQPISLLLDHLAAYRVPHSWFKHFYIISVLSSLFWAHQTLNHGAILQTVSSHSSTSNAPLTPSMTWSQIRLTWTLMLIQGLRRLFETIRFAKPTSTSTMWIGHYALGLGFYVLITPALCVEGLPALPGSLDDRRPSDIGVSFRPVALLLFVLASLVQFAAHAHLASLTHYVLPNHPLFRHVIAPHYTAEIVIYSSLAVVAAPEGCLVNWTVAAATLFVAVNLGVTARGTKEWYRVRFEGEKVQRTWVLMPGLW